MQVVQSHIMPLAMFQGVVVWAFKLFDILLCLLKSIQKLKSPDNRPLKHDQWHAADMGMI